MPKLARLRLVCIGHKDARFDDVVLDFRGDDGFAQNAALWLRNGGGKSSLLGLLFALLRPGTPLLRKNSRIDEYVLPGNQSVVVAEWERDVATADKRDGSGSGSLFAQEAPQYFLTGVFYERVESSVSSALEAASDAKNIRRRFFAAYAQPDTIGLNLNDLPLYLEADPIKNLPRRRRSLASFFQEWLALGKQKSGALIKETESVRIWAELLKAEGLDPQLFFYQQRMNQQEGGAYKLFDLKTVDNFVDLFVEMVNSDDASDATAQSLKEHAHKIKTKKGRMQERDLIRDLLTHLRPFLVLQAKKRVLRQKRAYGNTADQQLLDYLQRSITAGEAEKLRYHHLVETEQRKEQAAKAEIMRCRHRAALFRWRAAQAHEARLADEVKDCRRGEVTARYNRAVWRAVPLLRDWERAAQEVQNCQKQKEAQASNEHEQKDESAETMRRAACYYAAGLTARIRMLRQTQANCEAERFEAEKAASAARNESRDYEKAADNLRHDVEQLNRQIVEEKAVRACLHKANICGPNETPQQAADRLQTALAQSEANFAGWQDSADAGSAQAHTLRNQFQELVRRWGQTKAEIATQEQTLRDAQEAQDALLQNDLLASILQMETLTPDILRSAGAAFASRQLAKAVESAENHRIEAAAAWNAVTERVAFLQEYQTLPPEPAVRALLSLLHEAGITATWSGWYNLRHNIPKADWLLFIERHPERVRGLVVANADFERASLLLEKRTQVLQSPLVLCSRAYFENYSANENAEAVELVVTMPQLEPAGRAVFGPTSAAYYDEQKGHIEQEHAETEQEALRQVAEQSIAALETLYNLQSEYQQIVRRYGDADWWTTAQNRCQQLVQKEQKDLEALLDLRQIQENQSDTQDEARHTVTDHIAAWMINATQSALLQAHLDRFAGFNPAEADKKRHALLDQEEETHAQVRRADEESAIQETIAREKAVDAQAKGETAASEERELSEILLRAAITQELVRETISARPDHESGDDIHQLKKAFEAAWEPYRKRGPDTWETLLRNAQQREHEVRTKYQSCLSGNKAPIDNAAVRAALESLGDRSDAEEVLQKADRELEHIVNGLGRVQAQHEAAVEKTKAQFGVYENIQVKHLANGVEFTENLTADVATETAESLEVEADHLERAAENSEETMNTHHKAVARAQEQREKQDKILAVRCTQESELQRLIDEEREEAAFENDVENAAGEPQEPVIWKPPLNDAEIGERIVARQAERKAQLVEQKNLNKEGEALGRQVLDCLRDSAAVRERNEEALILMNSFQINVEVMAKQAEYHIKRLDMRLQQLESGLAEVEKHLSLLVEQVLRNAESAVDRLMRLEKNSVMPIVFDESGGKVEQRFLSIGHSMPPVQEVSARKNRIAALLEDLAQRNDPLPSGLLLLQQAVRRLAGPLHIRVLHPSQIAFEQKYAKVKLPYHSVLTTNRWSEGEKLTLAVLLYCSLAQFRASQNGKRLEPSGILVLDNPIGSASYVPFLMQQQGMARALGIQLIYATGLDDYDALRTFPVIVRLRNSQYDRRTGQSIIEIVPSKTERNGGESTNDGKNTSEDTENVVTSARLLMPTRSVRTKPTLSDANTAPAKNEKES